MSRPRRVLGPIVWIRILHGGIRIGDIIPTTWRGSWRRRHGDGFGAGVGRGRFRRVAGSLEGLVCVSDGRLCLGWRLTVLGAQLLRMRRQPTIELRRLPQQGILIRLPTGRVHRSRRSRNSDNRTGKRKERIELRHRHRPPCTGRLRSWGWEGGSCVGRQRAGRTTHARSASAEGGRVREGNLRQFERLSRR